MPELSESQNPFSFNHLCMFAVYSYRNVLEIDLLMNLEGTDRNVNIKEGNDYGFTALQKIICPYLEKTEFWSLKS